MAVAAVAAVAAVTRLELTVEGDVSVAGTGNQLGNGNQAGGNGGTGGNGGDGGTSTINANYDCITTEFRSSRRLPAGRNTLPVKIHKLQRPLAVN